MAGKEKDEKSAEAAEGAGAEGEQPKKKKLAGKTLILFVVAPLLVLGGGGAGAYFMFFAKKPGDAQQEEAKEEKKPPKPMVFYNLPELLVNLSGQGRRSSFLKISLSLELDDANDIPRIEAVLPRIVNAFQTYLREMRPEDLRGSAGLYRLREELLARVNTSAQPAKVNDVLFKEMLIQ